MTGSARFGSSCFDRDAKLVEREAKLLTVTTALQPRDLRLYGDEDPREQPRYTFPEASRATEIPTSTLRSWVVGQAYRRKQDVAFFEPVIERPDPDDSRLSFANLIEAHVLRALRTVHDVKLSAIREAVTIAEEEFGIQRLLVSPALRTGAGKLFLDRYASLIELSPSRQFALREILVEYLERVKYDESKLPAEFYPFERSPRNRGARVILLSPFISFGRPVIRRRGISTRAIVQRLDAGEDVAAILEDYGITEPELEEAILYEAAA